LLLSDPCGRIQVSTYKRTKMVYKTLASQLADDLVELHNVGGIELEQWQTAYEFVKIYYNTEEIVQIVIREKKV